MKFVLMLLVAAIAVVYFGRGVATDLRGDKAQASISRVNDLLRRAAEGQPLDGRKPPDSRWVERMTAACKKRERRLDRLPRATTAGGIADRGARILAIDRAYTARVASLRPSAGYAADGREIRKFNRSQLRILTRVVAAARGGDLGRASQETVALRELAGRANATFLRLGLARCAFGPSGMPL